MTLNVGFVEIFVGAAAVNHVPALFLTLSDKLLYRFVV